MNHIRRYDEDTVTGKLEWDLRPGATYEVHLDVHPKYQRMGIGRSMLMELEALADANGIMSLYSFCAYDNQKARAFFKGVGFKRIFLPDFYGMGRHAYFLWKPIGAPK